MISGADIMIKCLESEGVSAIFGYPGAAVVPFYQSLSGSGIRHILTRGEQGAGHAANGYARITGRPGVCVATSGPGATNLFTAIATAYSDSIPMVAITGQVETGQLGHDVFQEVDTTGAAEPFTKYSYLVKSAADLCRVFKEAFYIASTGRKGPVLIDVPVDIQQQLADFNYPDAVSIRGYKPVYSGHPLQIKRVREALGASKKPLLCFGGGVFLSEAAELAREFCERYEIPAVSTLMGTGVLPAGHPLYFGMIGQSGERTANEALNESDLLMLMGARAGNRALHEHSGSGKAVVHIDIDSAEIGKNVDTTIPLVGDVAEVLRELLKKKISMPKNGWTKKPGGAEPREAACGAGETGVDPERFIRALCEKLPEGSVYVADVGQNQIWSARNYSAPGRFLTTGGMGTMGYSIPAALGAKAADPLRTVVAVCGDGAFQMALGELGTLCQHGIDIKIVVMRNGRLGLVRELQRKCGGAETAVDLAGSPDYCLIAQAYGIESMRVEKNSDIEEAAQKLITGGGAFLLECVVAETEGEG